VQFLRPARPGRLTGRGRVVRRGREVAFLAGELLDDSGQVVATAVATAQIRAMLPRSAAASSMAIVAWPRSNWARPNSLSAGGPITTIVAAEPAT
jgi:uncharacterized protein (DUF3084 family)